MDRAEFLKQLERLLSDIPESERIEALEYYNSYFDDAGEGSEARVIQELGSPGKVAAIIKADLRESGVCGEYTERGYEDPRTRDRDQVPGSYGDRGRRGYRAPKTRSTGQIVLIVLLLILASPLILGAVSALAGIVLTVLCIAVVIPVVGVVITATAVIGGIGLVVAGIQACFTVPAVGLVLIGIGLLSLTAGILLFLAALWIGVKFLPWLFRALTDLFHRLLDKGADWKKERASRKNASE